MPSPELTRLKLTKRAIDALAPMAKERVVFDAELPGYGVKITPAGRKIFLVQYRYPPGRSGRIRRYTIGAYGAGLTPDQARSIALQVKGKIAAGIDPVADREELRALARLSAEEKQRQRAQFVDVHRGNFIARHAKPRLRSWREYERMLEHHVLPTGAGGRSPTSSAPT